MGFTFHLTASVTDIVAVNLIVWAYFFFVAEKDEYVCINKRWVDAFKLLEDFVLLLHGSFILCYIVLFYFVEVVMEIVWLMEQFGWQYCSMFTCWRAAVRQ